MTLPLALTLGSLIVATNSRQEFITEPEHQVGTFSCLCILIMMMMIIIVIIMIVTHHHRHHYDDGDEQQVERFTCRCTVVRKKSS